KRLAGEDAADAYRAMWHLRRDPERAVELVKKNVKPSPPGPDEKEFKKLLTALDDDDAQVRDDAERALRKHGRAVEHQLREVMKGEPTLEVRRRVKRLLSALPSDQSNEAPGLRGVELLEGVGTEPARRVLAELAKGNLS